MESRPASTRRPCVLKALVGIIVASAATRCFCLLAGSVPPSVALGSAASRSFSRLVPPSVSMKSSSSGPSDSLLQSDQSASNPDLIEDLKLWSESARYFEAIWLYKTPMSHTGSKELQQFAQKGLDFHHEGIVLMHAPLSGHPSRYLKLDFGWEGLEYSKHNDFPEIPDRIPWDEKVTYKKSTISRSRNDPKHLVEVLKNVKGMKYHCLKWNCQSFAKEVWDKFVPEGEPDASKTWSYAQASPA